MAQRVKDSEESSHSPKQTKDQTYGRILNTAIHLDFQKGHQRWTLSDLARSAKVTRSLIYYYFGRSREDILNEAVHLLGEEFFGLNSERTLLWSSGRVVDSVKATRKSLEQYPWLAAFYMIHRHRPTKIGEAIRNLEKRYLKKISQYFPNLSMDGVRGLMGSFYGLVFAPEISEAAIEQSCRLMMRVGKTLK